MSASGGFIGTGSENPKKGSYKVNLAGLDRCAWLVPLLITGATGTNIVGFTILTNIVAFTNAAANPPVVGYVTNSTASTNRNAFSVPYQFVGGQFIGGGSWDYFMLTTNGAGTANVTITNNSICEAVDIPPLVITNTVDCIRTIFGNGKVLGQIVSGSGTNEDIAYPNPALPSQPLDP